MKAAQHPHSRILVIDDNRDNLELSRSILTCAGYEDVRLLTDPTSALETYKTYAPDLVIIDLHMPKVDGFMVLEELGGTRRPDCSVPILVFTVDLTYESRTRALALGATDFLTKPGDPAEIALRVHNFLRLRHVSVQLERHVKDLELLILERAEELYVSRRETLECLALAGERRDDNTGKHTARVADMSAAIAAELGLNDTEILLIKDAAPLHDIGKIAVPDNVLLKPGALTDDEYELMKTHTTHGADILGNANSPVLSMARLIANFHHERWDGSGYPLGLKGEDIPMPARIVSVADTYDAMTNDRPYRKALPVEKAVAEIEKCAGGQFDPLVVAAFLRVLINRQASMA